MKEKILIVEDDINISNGLAAKFAVSNISSEVYNGAGSILNIINKIKVDLPNYIVLDLILPDMSGFELLNRIKADEDIFSIPVFVFSDMSDDDVRARCHNLGADYYFLKEELNVDEFVTKVVKILNNRNKILK